jgi:hypothetical protein
MISIGFRVEIIKNMTKRDFKKIMKSYNNGPQIAKILDFKMNSYVAPDKVKDMIIVKSCENKRCEGGVVNFSIMLPVKRKSNVERLVRIINILGNNRLIKEKISLFVKKRSMLNDLPELNDLINGLARIEEFFPNILKVGYYYAPEARFSK